VSDLDQMLAERLSRDCADPVAQEISERGEWFRRGLVAGWHQHAGGRLQLMGTRVQLLDEEGRIVAEATLEPVDVPS
jgi:hypothetical protein